jgi:hypothetical protein
MSPGWGAKLPQVESLGLTDMSLMECFQRCGKAKRSPEQSVGHPRTGPSGSCQYPQGLRSTEEWWH